MTKHNLIIHEGAAASESVNNTVKVELKKYLVTAPAGLFKRGKLYKKGVKIELDKTTADNFIRVGEVKEIKK